MTPLFLMQQTFSFDTKLYKNKGCLQVQLVPYNADEVDSCIPRLSMLIRNLDALTVLCNALNEERNSQPAAA